MNRRAFIGSLTGAGYLELIRQGLDWIGFGNAVSRQSRVFVKPNLTFPSYRPGVMTSPDAVEAALTAILDYTPRVYVGDADSGGYNPFSMDEVYRETGLVERAARLGVSIVNLSREARSPTELSVGRRRLRVELPRLLTEEIDLLVTVPVPKMHANSTVSLTFKNQWGCIPEPRDRLRLHPYLAEVLVGLNRAVRAGPAIVDGRFGLTEGGPMRGRAVPLDWVVVTGDIGTGARVTCELMQVPLDRARHLRHARMRGLIPDLADVQLNTDLRPFLRERFVLRRAWTDYPGWLAFRSRPLAYLAYFSPLAGVLHRLLYLVREPFYDYGRPSGR